MSYSKRLRILVIGGGEWGKDTVCNAIAKETELTVANSSTICSDVVFKEIARRRAAGETDLPEYNNANECWNDRRQYRQLWQDIINDFNTPDLTRLSRLIYTDHDIYNGLRNIDEFNKCMEENVFDLIIFVDASKRLKHDKADFPLPWDAADWVIDNNSTEHKLMKTVEKVVVALQELTEFSRRYKNVLGDGSDLARKHTKQKICLLGRRNLIANPYRKG